MSRDGVSVREELIDLRFVGPATGTVLDAAGIEPADLREHRITHTELIEAGVNPGVAAKIRREYSLSWSLEGGEDLDRRAKHVRGLQDAEREWVEASAADWDESTNVTYNEPTNEGVDSWTRRPWPNEPDPDSEFEAEAEWREPSEPTPLTSISELDAEERASLANAGITSVRRLATCNTRAVASSIEVQESTIRAWRSIARAQRE